MPVFPPQGPREPAPTRPVTRPPKPRPKCYGGPMRPWSMVASVESLEDAIKSTLRLVLQGRSTPSVSVVAGASLSGAGHGAYLINYAQMTPGA
jgi:hypothetical protein